MKKNLLLRMGALTPAVPAPGLAQGVSTTARTPAPDQRYESAFAGYKACEAYEEPAPADWRAANDAVGRASQKGDGHAAAGVSMPPAGNLFALSRCWHGDCGHH